MLHDTGPGIRRLLGIHYYVRDLERSRSFYVDLLDFAEVGCSTPELERRALQRSLVFRAGQCDIVCSQPIGKGGRADRYLSKHPDGVGTIAFEVSGIEELFIQLDKLGANPISEVQTSAVGTGWYKTFSITTPFGDTTFRFIERQGCSVLFPGMLEYATPTAPSNRFALTQIDHVTSNFQTMSPALLWLEHVLGFERFWHVSFHTEDVGKLAGIPGSGLRSVVMWHRASGIKFANNEPYRPHFKTSQINVFHEEHRGDGVQHVALATTDILSAVSGLRARGVQFMPTPGAYYERLLARLQEHGIDALDENVATLKQLGILVDGEGPGSYLLQIFLRDSAGTYGVPEAGPFFYELIQRKGDSGFGAGNFRALFESIERTQVEQGGP